MKIKKILIGIVIILIIIILSNVFMMLFHKVAIKIATRQENQVIENETSNEVIENIVEDNEIQEEIEVEENIQDDENLQEMQETQEIKEKQDVEQVQADTNKKLQASQKASSNTSGSSNSQNKQTQSTQTTITTTTTQTPKQETVVTSTPSVEVTTQTVEDKSVRNDAMISKMKQVIQNNETEDMKKYGYQIVIDSSIKDLTNQFTFTESRMINFLRNRFGTIRIYAEDWYKNGTFTMTACYIL